MDNQLEQLRTLKHNLTRFMMMYKFALEELETKIRILNDEFHSLHEYNPIEHTKSRVKSPESILRKLSRKGVGDSLSSIKENIRDIAGLRITCSFTEDIYWISSMLQSQEDITVVEVKDYIQNPKPNGYRSLHLILQVPVFMSDRQELVYVEVQIRTIAMDFWASLEHKIFYKYEGDVPKRLLDELTDAANSAMALDMKMEKLHKEIETIKLTDVTHNTTALEKLLPPLTQEVNIPQALLKLANSPNW